MNKFEEFTHFSSNKTNRTNSTNISALDYIKMKKGEIKASKGSCSTYYSTFHLCLLKALVLILGNYKYVLRAQLLSDLTKKF